MSIGRKSQLVFHILFAGLITWWFVIWISGSRGTSNYFFNLALSFCSMYSGVLVFLNFLKWRKVRTSYAVALLFFSIAIFGQAFGALVFSYYNFGGFSIANFLNPQKIEEVPYPGIADLFYGAFPLTVIIGVSCLAWAQWFNNDEQNFGKMVVSVITPIVTVLVSWVAFMNIISVRPVDLSGVSWSGVSSLDLYYNVGDSIVLAIASILLIYLGYFKKMRLHKPIICLILGFICAYLADYLFFFRFSSNQYFIGDYPDIFYTLSPYFVSLGGILFVPSSQKATS